MILEATKTLVEEYQSKNVVRKRPSYKYTVFRPKKLEDLFEVPMRVNCLAVALFTLESFSVFWVTAFLQRGTH